MATTPTNKPIPSEDPRDLKFNAGKIDEVVTSDSHYYTDRFGVRRWTIAGFQYTAEEAIRNYGYITMDSFEDGATLTLPNQVLRYEATGEYYRWDGEFPKTVSSGSTPDSTGEVKSGAWVSVGDASLRSQLASKLGYSLIGELDSVSGFYGLYGENNSRVKLKSWSSDYILVTGGKPTGGGEFIFRDNMPKSAHNGGTIISPTVPYSDASAFLQGAGETDASGSGCWVRDFDGAINVLWFGAVGDGISDSSDSIQQAIDQSLSNHLGEIYFPAGVFLIKNTINIQNCRGLKISGSGYGGDLVTGWSGAQDHVQTNLVWSGAQGGVMFNIGGAAFLSWSDIDFVGSPDGSNRASILHSWSDVSPTNNGFATGNCDYTRCSFSYATTAINCGSLSTDLNCSDMTFKHITGKELVNFLKVNNDQGVNYVFQYTNLDVEDYMFWFARGGVLNATHTSGNCDYILRIDTAGVNNGQYLLDGVSLDFFPNIQSKVLLAADTDAGKKSVVTINNLSTPQGQPTTDPMIKVNGNVQVNVNGGMIVDTNFADINNDAPDLGEAVLVCTGCKFDTTYFAFSKYFTVGGGSEVVIDNCSDALGRVLRNTNDSMRTGFISSVVRNTPYSSATRMPVNHDLAPDRNKTFFGRKGHIKGLSIATSANLTAGTLSARVMINGIGIPATEVSISATESAGLTYIYFKNPTLKFSATDFIEVQWQTDAEYAAPSAVTYATLYVDFGDYGE